MASSAAEPSPSSPSSAKRSDDLSNGVPKDWKFWCIIFSLALSILLTAIELTSIGAALPTITRSLKGEQFIFPILASIPVTQTAPAMALYVFSRKFGSIWGITTGGAIIQNELKNRLPTSFLTQFSQGVEIAFETIPIIPSLNQLLKDDVRNTFGIALKVVWQVVLGISIAGMLCNIGVKQLKLHTRTGVGRTFRFARLLAPLHTYQVNSE